jgi:hypothetical protein
LFPTFQLDVLAKQLPAGNVTTNTLLYIVLGETNGYWRLAMTDVGIFIVNDDK